jgi:hypothetical protein
LSSCPLLFPSKFVAIEEQIAWISYCQLAAVKKPAMFTAKRNKRKQEGMSSDRKKERNKKQGGNKRIYRNKKQEETLRMYYN